MIFYNARIITMECVTYENGFIETNGTKILRMGRTSALEGTSADDIDCKGKTILPGFVDAHCHLGMFGDGVGFEGDDGNEETDPCTPQLRSIDAINPLDRNFSEALDAGITSVMTGMGSANAIGGQWVAMKTHGTRIDNMVFLEPSAMKFALGENPKVVYHSKNTAPNTRMATASIIREQLTKAQRYLEDVKKAEDDEDYDRPEYDAKCEALLPVLKREVKAHFHCHRSDDIFTAIRLAKEFSLDLVVVHCTEGHLISDELGKEQIRAVIGPVISDRSKPELANQTIKLAQKLFTVGVELAICTDHPEVPIQYLPLSAALCVRGGLDYDYALRAITINAAEISGISDRVGSLKVGKDADFVLFDGDPLDVQQCPNLVVINGEIVRDNR